MKFASIAEFYKGKSVFITGGTGFLGKVLIEKLLRSCPEVENIYLLVRQKKDISVDKRHKSLTNSPAFDYLREIDPKSLDKIKIIYGDISNLGLGMSEEDRTLLCDKVSIVINSAATVKFNEPLRVAVNTNLRSVDELIKLSREMKLLEAFVHISTAYTNWFEGEVEEKVYGTKLDPKYLINLCGTKTDEQLNELLPTILGKHVNTYSFTKALAENLAYQEAANLPLVIIRPSIVGASLKEPHVGWTDAYTASTPFLDLISRGILRTVNIKKGCIFDIIPVDLVINLTIALSWNLANNRTADAAPEVFFSISGSTNPISAKKLVKISRDIGRVYPSNKKVCHPQMRVHESNFLYRTDLFLTHYIPAYLMDIGNKFKGRNSRFVNSCRKLDRGFKAINFVSTNPINFRAKNFKKVFASMTEADQQEFNFDPQSIDWIKYFENYYFGIQKFIHKENNVVNDK